MIPNSNFILQDCNIDNVWRFVKCHVITGIIICVVISFSKAVPLNPFGHPFAVKTRDPQR